ncbi:MAG: nucleotidyltransferase [Alphaproteobacteria bacterium PA3]|nr:MAG: nucleotidyltransferase [Alphaproteobacteria bacterium PA3]
MTVNSYLVKRASDAVLSSNEQSSIETSISTLRARLNSYFGEDVSNHFKFGSSTRGTILPRSMDTQSDIDYMVVFKDGGYTPQTYLNKLKKFAEYYYQTSEIKQSSPSIMLELNHIKFDLVPALKDAYGSGYQIPNGPNAWQSTDPNDFNAALTQKNSDNKSLIKTTVRLLKFWNASKGYIFESFSLEKWVIGQFYYPQDNQRDYFLQSIEKLPVPTEVQWHKSAVERAKEIVANVRQYERDDMPATAEGEVKKLIPE